MFAVTLCDLFACALNKGDDLSVSSMSHSRWLPMPRQHESNFRNYRKRASDLNISICDGYQICHFYLFEKGMLDSFHSLNMPSCVV